ncbi:MAG: transcriptional regulator [Epulopiscium sp.]|jgi:TfoX/Sxy family transcriptional regulator of competence genes|nr:transcriptional regulator [Candidatus Epulonipiscium sp.]
MATSAEYVEFVCEQIKGTGTIRYRKMFGEYMVYVNEKPILLVCDNMVFVKKLDCIAEKMADAQKGMPYSGAKEHYILDIEDGELSKEIVTLLEEVTPLPKPKKKKTDTKKQ